MINVNLVGGIMGKEDRLTKREIEIVREAVNAYRKELVDEERNIEKLLVKSIKQKLVNYRRTKEKLANEVKLTKEEERELRYECIKDLMGNIDQQLTRSERRIQRNEEKRRKDLFEIQCLEKAVELYKKECNESASEEDKRRCRELCALYIDDNKKSVLQIAEEEMVSDKTVYKDIGIACKILTVYYF